MKEQVTAKAYAAALYQLGASKEINVADELTKFTEACNGSNELENVLFMEVFTSEEKVAVVGDLAKRLRLSQLISNFLKFLIIEKRIGLLPIIFKEVVVMDDYKKGFLRGTIIAATDEEKSVVKKIKDYLEIILKKDIQLTYEKNKNMTAGYRVVVGDFLLDASLDNQLEKFKKNILNI